jgi:hypothetical protein
MRTLWAVALLGVVTCGSTSGVAQTVEDESNAPLPAHPIAAARGAIHSPELIDPATQQQELEKWVRDYSSWKQWAELWANRREPGWFTSSRQRRQRPNPPRWLSDRCSEVVEHDDDIADACVLVAEWRGGVAAAQIATQRASATAGAEDTDKTTWWEHVHLDGGWPALQSGSSLVGVVGMHATTTVHGRLEIFVAPGAMLLNVPAGRGGRAWKVATNYGIAYRLSQFTLPGKRQAVLHLNLAKAWLLSAGDVPTKSTDFVGLSLTFKRTP